eukprot:384450-Amphidinium_carterae.1
MMEAQYDPSDMLVEHLAPASCNVRIGAFEVYLCCAAPLVLHRGTKLQVAGQPCARGYTVRCVASKLFTGMWPSGDMVLSRLRAALPLVPFHITVRTKLQTPVAG